MRGYITSHKKHKNLMTQKKGMGSVICWNLNVEFSLIQFNSMVWSAKPDKHFKDIETMAQGERGKKKKTDSENLVYDILNI